MAGLDLEANDRTVDATGHGLAVLVRSTSQSLRV
tara:strand:+ start:63302 stop:63403 length:102 start_codon:yes stop_codon:yes gene_type:complete